MTNRGKKTVRMGRRRFLQIAAVAGAAGLAYKMGFSSLGGATASTVQESRVMMGTQINLIVHGPDEEQCYRGVSETFSLMADLESLFSRYQPESELSRLNRDSYLLSASPDFLHLLDLAGDVHRLTGGAFDVSVLPLLQLYGKESLPERPLIEKSLALVSNDKIERKGNTIRFLDKGMGITLDGIGKGYIVDQGVACLRSNGFGNVYVEAGGDLMVSGNRQSGQPWRIGLRNPRPKNPAALLSIQVSDRAVATSGDYIHNYTEDRRHHHIIDPRTGVSSPELASATVLAPTVALADGLATAAMVLGAKKSIELLESMEGCEGLFIAKDLSRHQTSAFQS